MKKVFWRRTQDIAGGSSTVDRGGGGEETGVITVSKGLEAEGIRGVGRERRGELRDVDGAMHLHLNARALPANFLKSRHFDQ